MFKKEQQAFSTAMFQKQRFAFVGSNQRMAQFSTSSSQQEQEDAQEEIQDDIIDEIAEEELSNSISAEEAASERDTTKQSGPKRFMSATSIAEVMEKNYKKNNIISKNKQKGVTYEPKSIFGNKQKLKKVIMKQEIMEDYKPKAKVQRERESSRNQAPRVSVSQKIKDKLEALQTNPVREVIAM